MRLSDAFEYPDEKKPESFPLELIVKVYNINLDKGGELLGKCETLMQYSKFIEIVRKSIKEKIENPLTRAVKEAISHGILTDYLERKSTEVINMLTMEYDYAADIAAQKEESLEEGKILGLEQGIRNLILNMKLTHAQAMEALGIPPEERSLYLSQLNSH